MFCINEYGHRNNQQCAWEFFKLKLRSCDQQLGDTYSHKLKETWREKHARSFWSLISEAVVEFASSVLKEWTAAVGIIKYMWVLNHDSVSK